MSYRPKHKCSKTIKSLTENKRNPDLGLEQKCLTTWKNCKILKCNKLDFIKFKTFDLWKTLIKKKNKGKPETGEN